MRGLRLTPRGLTLLVAGSGLAGLGVLYGVELLATMGSALLLTVVAGLAALAGGPRTHARRRLVAERVCAPDPVPPGHWATVVVRVRNPADDDPATSREAVAGCHLEEVESGGGPDRTSPGPAPGGGPGLVYRVRSGRRGRWPLGPLVATTRDAFGVARLDQRIGGAGSLRVHATLVPLAPPGPTLPALEDPSRSSVGEGHDDVVLREYRSGDDLRRVHWASAARHGTPMVRTGQALDRPATGVLLDAALLRDQHAMSGQPPGMDRSGEWAVAAAVSIAVCLSGGGHPVRLYSTLDHPSLSTLPPARAGGDEGTLLARTVDMAPPAGTPALDPLIATARVLEVDPGRDRTLYAVLGPLTPAQADALARLATTRRARALLLSPTDDGRPDVAGDARPDATAVAVLRRSGWSVRTVSPGTLLTTAWHDLHGTTS